MIDANAPATPGTATPAPTAPAIPVEPYRPANLSPSHTAEWIEIEKANLAAGKTTPEEATRRFDALGASPEQRGPDTRSDEVKQFDAAFPPAKPEDFIIRYHEPGQFAPPMTPEIAAFDQSARAWLSGGEFSRDSGNALVAQIEQTVRATKGMTPEQLESYGLVEFAKLEKAYGETLDEKLHAAALMIDALDKKQPGLKALLRTQGIGDSALVANILMGQAERYWMRRTGR